MTGVTPAWMLLPSHPFIPAGGRNYCRFCGQAEKSPRHITGWARHGFIQDIDGDACVVCGYLESDRCHIPTGATICVHGVEPFDCHICFPIGRTND